MAPMPRPAAARFHDIRPIHWLPLCPLLPACTGPVTGATLMLAAVITAIAVTVGSRALTRSRVSDLDVLPGLIVAAGMAGLIDLGLRACAPSLHAQIGAALPLLALAGLIRADSVDRAPWYPARIVPAALVILVLATLHAAFQPGVLAREWALLSVSDHADPTLPGLSPATSLIGLALLLAAVNAGRAAAGNGPAK